METHLKYEVGNNTQSISPVKIDLTQPLTRREESLIKNLLKQQLLLIIARSKYPVSLIDKSGIISNYLVEVNLTLGKFKRKNSRGYSYYGYKKASDHIIASHESGAAVYHVSSKFFINESDQLLIKSVKRVIKFGAYKEAPSIHHRLAAEYRYSSKFCYTRVKPPILITERQGDLTLYSGYLLMAYLPEQDLDKLLAKDLDQMMLSTPVRIELAIAIIQAVQRVHQQKLIHRDLKPANLIVKLQDKICAWVIDFEYSKKAQCHDYFEAGTLGFRPPEVKSGYFTEGNSSYQSDIFALVRILGCLFRASDPIKIEYSGQSYIFQNIFQGITDLNPIHSHQIKSWLIQGNQNQAAKRPTLQQLMLLFQRISKELKKTDILTPRLETMVAEMSKYLQQPSDKPQGFSFFNNNPSRRLEIYNSLLLNAEDVLEQLLILQALMINNDVKIIEYLSQRMIYPSQKSFQEAIWVMHNVACYGIKTISLVDILLWRDEIVTAVNKNITIDSGKYSEILAPLRDKIKNITGTKYKINNG